VVADLTLHAKEQARQAYEAGRLAGEAAAVDRLEAEVRSVSEKLGAAISEVAQTRAAVIRRAEGDTVRLAVEIARRILHRELSTDVTAFESLIKAALQKLQALEIYKVRVHPDQEQLVRTCLEQAGRGQGLAVTGDSMQPKGGAVFEIGSGALDASVETQVREIERALTDQLEARE
jgi:flagellar biosynthesis/type III secretory pathway protein FliH